MHILFFQDLLGVARRGRRESNDNTTNYNTSTRSCCLGIEDQWGSIRCHCGGAFQREIAHID